MLQGMINHHKTNWHHIIFSSHWAYRVATKTTTRFTPVHLIHSVEEFIPIGYETVTLHIVLNILFHTTPLEHYLLHLKHLN